MDRTASGILQTYDPKAIYVTIPPFAMVPLYGQTYWQNIRLPSSSTFGMHESHWAIAPNGTYFPLSVSIENGKTRGTGTKAAAVLVSLGTNQAGPAQDTQNASTIPGLYEGYNQWA